MPFRRACLTLLCLVTALSGTAFAETQGRRIALVIGNGGYRNVDRLANPASDARLIANALRAASFTLVGGGAQIDLDKSHFERVVQQFGHDIEGAEVALFYYSGHGMQVQGVNWLVPIDANPTAAKDLGFQMLDASLILRQMEAAGTKLNLVILDACRNNPFAVRGISGSSDGLAEMRAPEGTMISYATQLGSVAADGTTGNSPYTTALVDAIHRPGLDVFQVFNQVGLTVKQATAGAQQPWLASSPIAGNFYFFNNGPANIVMPAPIAPVPSARSFDGKWDVTLSCEISSDGALASYIKFSGVVTDGHLHASYGVLGTPDSLELQGTIDPDGTANFLAAGLSGDSKYNIGRPNPGHPYSYHASGRFTADHGAAKRLEARPCSLDFIRQTQ